MFACFSKTLQHFPFFPTEAKKTRCSQRLLRSSGGKESEISMYPLTDLFAPYSSPSHLLPLPTEPPEHSCLYNQLIHLHQWQLLLFFREATITKQCIVMANQGMMMNNDSAKQSPQYPLSFSKLPLRPTADY